MPIDSRSIYNAVRQAAQRAGLDKRVHPHTLRHYLPFRTMSCRGMLALCFGANELICSDIV